MANYGEALTYWYLRLNGFFPLHNFVLHRQFTRDSASDCDMLAVRFPHVFERVGGHPLDWDQPFLRKVGASGNRIVGIIAEVKAGRTSRAEVETQFSTDRLAQAIQRMGFIENDRVADCADQLAGRQVLTTQGFSIAKVAFFQSGLSLYVKYPFLLKTLAGTERFIRKRMRIYRTTKAADRMYFPDELIQYFAAKAGVGEVDG